MKIQDNRWQLRFWRFPAWSDVDFLHVANLTHYYPRHIHEEYCLVIVLRGRETHLRNGKTYDALPGSVMLLNPDEAHSSKSIGTEYRVVHISPSAMTRMGSQVIGSNFRSPYFAIPVVNDPVVFDCLLSLHLAGEQNASRLDQDALLLTVVGLILTRQCKTECVRKTGRELTAIRLAQNYLKANYAENVSLTRLASEANLSPFYLLRSFHKQIGVPPHEYQIQVRISRAKQLIQAGLSISQAAQETGFFDQSHLIRNFKRIVGTTPGQYFSQSNIVQDISRRV